MIDECPGSDRYQRPEVAARFDDGAPQQPRTRRRRRRERHLLAQLLGRVPNLRSPVLDVPCGAGRFAALWSDFGLRAVQVDRSPAMTRIALKSGAARGAGSARLPAGMATARGSVFALPFPDRHFDAVLCARFFHHLGEPELCRRAWNELARVSRRAVLVTFLHPISAHGLTRRAMVLLGRRSTRHGHRLSFFTTLAKESGFRLAGAAADWRYVREHWAAIFERVSPEPVVRSPALGSDRQALRRQEVAP